MARTAIITHLQMLEHTHGPGHPERPERLSTILETLEKQDITNNTLQLTSTLAPLEVTQAKPILVHVA